MNWQCKIGWHEWEMHTSADKHMLELGVIILVSTRWCCRCGKKEYRQSGSVSL